jgi:cell division protein FtsI (penicillin-binding protein 3)
MARRMCTSPKRVGLAGTERFHDETLRDPARDGDPLRLSIDLAAQAALTDALRAGHGTLRRAGPQAC